MDQSLPTKLAPKPKSQMLPSLMKVNNNPKVFWFKIAMFLVTDALCILGILQIGTILTKTAQEVKKSQASKIGSDTKNQKDILEGELQKNKESSEKLLAYFPNDDQILEFVLKVDELKKLELITNFDFVTNEPIKDKLGLLSIPVLFTIKGEDTKISEALGKLIDLPYVMRPVAINIAKESSQSAAWSMQWGGVLYVDERYDKN